MPFDDVLVVATEKPEQLIALEEALTKLAEEFPRQAKVVELRYFGGHKETEVADMMSISVKTVKRDWRFARTWLNREIRREIRR